MCRQLYLRVDTNNLHTVILYQVFLSNMNSFHMDLFDP